jgi:hypothetical protein
MEWATHKSKSGGNCQGGVKGKGVKQGHIKYRYINIYVMTFKLNLSMLKLIDINSFKSLSENVGSEIEVYESETYIHNLKHALGM